MDKFKTFFLRVNFMTEAEYEELSKYATFSIKLPTSNLNVLTNTTLQIKINAILPINLFKSFYQNMQKSLDKLNVVFVGSPLPVDEEQFTDYIQFYFDDHNIHNVLIRNLIERQAFSISDSGLVIITYDNKSELHEFKLIEEDLLSFFRRINFFVTGFDYEFNKNRQELEASKKAREEQLQASRVSFDSEKTQLLKVKKYNSASIAKFKCPSVKLNQIVYGGDDNYVIVTGEIFKVKIDSLKSGAQKYTFYITDYEDTFVITAFAGVKKASASWGMDTNLPVPYLNSLRVGDWVKSRVKIDQNKYTNFEVQGITNFIAKIDEKPKQFIREDKATKPRIELLAHTNMSTQDGMIDPERLVERSKTYKWPAIGVADRYNVHVYPTLMLEGNKHNQKICYGLECNVINKNIEIVKNPKNQEFNSGEYVVFDIETTGLHNEYDEITEFGAIKIRDNMIVEKVDWFVSITKPLSYKIKEKTHITDEMLKNQPGIKERLKNIKDFFGNATIIAHNAINFDVRFINKKLFQNGMPLLNNTVIDTIPLSYAINTHLTRHNLGVVSRDAKIGYDESIAHRADFDAEVLYQVWQTMVNKMKQLGINNVQDINTKLQNKLLHHHQFGNFVEIYARNQEGIKDIYRLVSTSHTDNLHKRPRVYTEDIKAKRWNLIIANHPTEGDIWDIAINGSDDQLALAMMFYDYIYVSPPKTLAHLVNRGEISELNIKKTIQKIIDTAHNLNKEVIVVSDAYYLDPWDKIGHMVYVHTKQLGGGSHRLFRYGDSNEILPDLHLRTTEEMLDEFAFIKDEQTRSDIVINNTYKFVEEVQSNLQPVKDKPFRPKIGDVDTKLKTLVSNRAHEIYGEKVPDEIQTRIDHEIKMITSNDYSVIYWICHLLVKKTMEDGYIVGSRGSVGSSFVAYLAGISEVNPLKPHYYCSACKHVDFNVSNHADGFDLPPRNCPICGKPMSGDGHDIPFETFLGFETEPKVPDIDLNFSGDYQARAHNFIRDMFGEHHTFRAGTISTVADRTAFGYTKSYFELTQPNENIKPSTIEWIASKCVNVKRTTGQHPGGIIIVPKEYDILDFTPYNFPADDKTAGWYTTHFDFSKIHDNLLKFDILGHDDPTSLKMLEEITGIKPKDIPFQDDKVMKLYSSLDSMNIDQKMLLGEKVGSFGLPEFGTQFVRKMLYVAQPKSFADLVRVSGLSHGTDVWEGNAHQLIEQQGMKLSEVITCRDDIMIYLMRKGIDNATAFHIMESIRKGKSLKQSWETLMHEKGVPEWYTNACKKIKYLFPKAHATAYVMMSWRIGWFKIHYPMAFYATYFSVRPSVFDLQTIILGPEAIRNKLDDIKTRLASYITKKDVKQKEKDLIIIYELALEMYARGFSFKNISLTKSEAKKFIIDEKSLIPPFTALDGLGELAAQSIVDARKISPFVSKADLLTRSKISKTTMSVFNEMGITTSLDEDNQLTLFS